MTATQFKILFKLLKLILLMLAKGQGYDKADLEQWME